MVSSPKIQPRTRTSSRTSSKPRVLTSPKQQNHLITEFFPVRPKRRLTAKEVASNQNSLICHYLQTNTDPQGTLRVDEFDHKGKGIVADVDISKGSFICEYAGELIGTKEAKIREKHYSEVAAGSYMYYFKHEGRDYCLDATKPTGRLGRLINHSRKRPNCKPQVRTYRGKPRLIFLALRDIQPGEEILYDYGETDKHVLDSMPWLRDT